MDQETSVESLLDPVSCSLSEVAVEQTQHSATITIMGPVPSLLSPESTEASVETGSLEREVSMPSVSVEHLQAMEVDNEPPRASSQPPPRGIEDSILRREETEEIPGGFLEIITPAVVDFSKSEGDLDDDIEEIEEIFEFDP